jgi:hypothetical protein
MSSFEYLLKEYQRYLQLLLCQEWNISTPVIVEVNFSAPIPMISTGSPVLANLFRYDL